MYLNLVSILTTILFSIRALSCSVLNRKNILIIIMSIELMSTVTFIYAASAKFLNPKLEAVRPLVNILSKK